MLRNIFVILFLSFSLVGQVIAIREAKEPEESGGPKSVRSYLGNYIVTAPDAKTAAMYAKQAEDLRKLVAHILSDDRVYNITVYISIRPVREKQPGGNRWQVSLMHGGLRRYSGAILRNRIENAVKFYVVYCYLLDAAASEAAANKERIRDDQVPFWICAAVMENLTQAAREAHRDYMLTSLGKGRYIPLDELFRHRSRFRDEQQRALYFHQCGSVFDYLVTMPRGRKKVLESLRDLWRRDDLTISLLWHFKGDFASLGELEDKWSDFTRKRPEKFFDFKRLTIEETRKHLAVILEVEIISIDEKTIEEETEKTDFAGLMKHKNSTARINIAFGKMVELRDLKLRAPKAYQEVLGEYILSLNAIINGKKRNFKRHYEKANKLLKSLEAS